MRVAVPPDPDIYPAGSGVILGTNRATAERRELCPMLRAITVTAMLAALTLVATTVGAQSPEPIPTATADEVVFFGEVPAPPGTTVRVYYLFGPTREPVWAICDQTTTTASTSRNPSRSSFVVVIEEHCFGSTFDGPGFCWGEDLCSLAPDPSLPDLRRGGTTMDLGLLVRSGITVEDFGEGPLTMPAAGTGAQRHSSIGWLLLAGVALLVAGLAIGGVGLAVRQKG